MSSIGDKPNLELPLKPQPPEPYECCERGCDPCVYDYYARALARWEKRVAEISKLIKQAD